MIKTLASQMIDGYNDVFSEYDMFDVRSTSNVLITTLAHTSIFLSVEVEYSTSDTIEYWYNMPVFFTTVLTCLPI